jgi:hypothetical protein
MIKQSDLNKLMGNIGGRMSDAGSSIRNWYENNPDARNIALRGLIGAAGGAALSGGIAAMTPRDKEERGSIMRPALLGALMGGVGGAALPAGLKMLNGGIRFSGESNRPLIPRTLESVAAPIASNILTVGGGLGGLMYGSDAWRTLHHGMKGNSVGSIVDRVGNLVMDKAGKNPISRGVYGTSTTQAPVAKRFLDVIGNDKYWARARESNVNFQHTTNAASRMTKARTGRLAALPIGLVLGWIADKYAKGKY